MTEPPPNALGAELVWWREDGHQHTLLTIAAPLFAERTGATSLVLTFALHDAEGRFVTSWERALGASDTIFFDSRAMRADVPLAVTEGALVVWIAPAPDSPPPASRVAHSRAFAMVDWFTDDGALVSLHTDQSVTSMSRPLELTEMVFCETAAARTTLVIVNGREAQPVGALQIVLRNARGDERLLDYAHEMPPFSVLKLALAELTPDLVAFCGGNDATIAGRFEARGIFTRPYVITEGAVPAAYHGGDRYRSRSIPRLVHRTFPFAEAGAEVPWQMMLVGAQKELNPAYAVHRPDRTTRVHLFQSHGDLEEDFFVDAALYDTSGRLVTRRERWGVAPRHGQTTCDVAELCGGAPFEGHIALSYSEDASKEAFPRRVQALLEYRTAVSFARTMLWSDRWNAPDRVRTQRVAYRALFRVFSHGTRLSALAVTNACVSADYDREAPYVVRLRNAQGEELVYHGTLAPYATKVATIDELFPRRFADELAVAIVESPFDLASMHLTKDLRSGVIAAEHLLAVPEHVGDELLMPCGA